MYQIKISNAVDGVQIIQLNGVTYRLKMSWSGEFWALSLYTSDGQDIIRGVRVVVNYPLLSQYVRASSTIGGQLMAVKNTGDDKISRYDFATGRIKLVYIPNDEVENARNKR